MTLQYPVLIRQGLKPHTLAIFSSPAKAVPLLQSRLKKTRSSFYFPAQPNPSVTLPVAIIRFTDHVARSISATSLLPAHET